MAIEIIPKPTPKTPFWFNVLFYFSVIFLIFSLSSYFILNHFVKKAEVNLQDLRETLKEKKESPENKSLEKEILSYQKKIQDFSFLINQHKFNSNLFNFLEKLSHPRVWFSQFDFSSDKYQVGISGQAESFQALGQQLFIFKSEPLIENLNLSEISLGKEGEIGFTFNLTLSPQVFSPEL